MLKLVKDWLCWFFVPSGIVVVEESGKINWFEALKRLFSGGVKRDPDGPSARDFAGCLMLGKPLVRYRCRVCDVYFWGWRKREVCYKFGCYRERNV